MIGSNIWNEFCLYVISTVETGCNYNAVELAARRGIGIVQWSFGRSWVLLNLYAKDYPDEAPQHLKSLYHEVKEGSTKWEDRYFDDAEANFLISDTLKQPNMISTQNKLWLRDLKNDYIPILNKFKIDKDKSAIFALSLYHHRPASFYEVANGVGNGTLSDWYNGALNNGFFSGYRDRQKQVYNLLNNWDGVSSPPNGWAKIDSKPINGGNVDWNFGNPIVNVGDNGNSNDPNGNYANTSTESSNVTITIGKIEFIGNECRQHFTIGEKDVTALFYKESPTLWTCANMKELIVNVRQTTGSTTTGTPVGEAEEGDTEEGSTTPIKAKSAIDYVKSVAQTLHYSQNMNQRTDIEGGYADCSGLVYWAYRKCGVTIGTYTGTQKNNGRLIVTIHNDAEYQSLYINAGKVQAGDIIVFFNSLDRGSDFHVEMIDSDGTLWGINTPEIIGPTQKQTPTQAAGYFAMAEIRRIITGRT